MYSDQIVQPRSSEFDVLLILDDVQTPANACRSNKKSSYFDHASQVIVFLHVITRLCFHW
jgi:hypothetical protein